MKGGTVDVWRITLAALRRWYVLFPLLGLTAFAAVNVGNSVEPEYQATATIMYVAGPGESDVPNPYGDLVGAGQVVSIVLGTAETQRALAEAGHTAAYEIQAGNRSSITTMALRADSVEDAEGTGTALIEAAQVELAARQGEAGIPASAQVTLQVLEPPTVIEMVQNGKVRIQATIGVIGAALALAVAVLFDDIIGLIKRMRRKRRSTVDSDAGADDEAVIHTDEWVWPDDQRPVPIGRPTRNPYFDPEYTKRSVAKLAAEGRRGDEHGGTTPHDTSIPAEAAGRP